MKPNIIVLGVGHAGTSILTRMLFAMGWNGRDAADARFAEHIGVRRLNRAILAGDRIGGTEPARHVLDGLTEPWAVKDPRFVVTLDDWIEPLAKLRRPPTLLWLRRGSDALAHSYRRRGEQVGDGPGVAWRTGRESVVRYPLDELLALAHERFELWPWHKLAVDYERIADAVALFRRRASNP